MVLFILALSRLIDTAYLCYISTIPICLAWSGVLLRPLDSILAFRFELNFAMPGLPLLDVLLSGDHGETYYEEIANTYVFM